MPSEFRDAIADAAQRHTAYRNQAESIAAEVLAMPEMEAIRRALHDDAMLGDGGYFGADRLRTIHRLPESMIDWVLGDDDE